ncbi:MAG: hypothetical protein U9R23_08760 [Candidatus Cloacimonadota bacterium]|nr:hypothetical protein [Candidatus Cloacimonadota bacterium]
MRNTNISLAIFLIFSVFIVSCTSPTSSEKASITGRVFCADSGNPAGGAKVWLKKIVCPPAPIVYKSTYTNNKGYFCFNDVENGYLRIYACKYINSDESNVSYISPIYNFFYEGESIYKLEDIFLNKVFENGTIIGNVFVSETQVPADSAVVILKKIDGKEYENIDSVFSDTCGNYTFENVRTGPHLIYASKIDTSLGFPDKIVATLGFYCNGKDSCNLDTLFLKPMEDRKPAIYIYPEEERKFQVKLILKNGTRITKSIPEYNSGWDVFVEKSGRIDSKYDYLFYEASIKIMPELSSGWCISQKNLKNKLNSLLLKVGLNQKEINEFLDYWLNILKDYNYYKIYPLFNEQIDYYVELKINPKPKTIFRMRFFFQGCKNFEELPSPQINDFVREGTTVIEWGGVLLN